MQIPFTLGTGTNAEADPVDRLPVNFTYTPKPNFGYMDMSPGIAKLSTGLGKDRGGLYVQTDKLKGHFRVSGNNLVKLEGDVVTKIGDAIISGDRLARIIVTNNNLVITVDGKQYLYNAASGLRLNPADNLGNPIDSCFMNERVIDITPDPTNNITYIVQHAAGQDDVIKPLAFGTSDARADEVNGIGYLTGNRVIVFNRFSCEVFRDDGIETPTKEFTLAREESRAIDGGLIATKCKAPYMGSWALIGGTERDQVNVHMLGSGKLQPLGTSEIQSVLAEYTQDEFSKAWLETRAQDGHDLLICQLPRHTLQFDGATQQWSILKTGLQSQTWRASHGVYDPVMSKWVYGDKVTSNYGYLDKSVFSQYGEAQEAILFTPMMPMYNQIVTQIQIRTVGGRYPDGFTQNAFLSMSNLGGQAFGNESMYEVSSGLNYSKRFLWRGFGMANGDIGYRFRIVSKYPSGIGDQMELM